MKPSCNFPPQTELAESWNKNGKRWKEVLTKWGRIPLPVQRFVQHGKEKDKHLSIGMTDTSGVSPWVLNRYIDLGSRLPYNEASDVLYGFGINVGDTKVNTICHEYNLACQSLVDDKLDAATFDILPTDSTPLKAAEGKTWVLEVDGVIVLKKPIKGECHGLEIKDAVLYPLNAPSQRYMYSSSCNSEVFSNRLSGLLRCAGVKREDKILGLGDGALWIADAFELLAIPYLIDVYHATSYLDTVMTALGWDEQRRARHRRKWCKGQSYASYWLKHYIPDVTIVKTWSDDAQTAYRYLEKRQDHMNYKQHKAKDYPIGSGQVEGMNKAVIGKRMKQSGMQWSPEGAAAMATQRSQFCAAKPLGSFQQIRQLAFGTLPALAA